MRVRVPSNVYYPFLGRCYVYFSTLNQLSTQEGEKVRISTVVRVNKEWCEYQLRLGLGVNFFMYKH